MKQAPVRIVGGGVSGLTAAIVLARGGAEVEVFERRPAATIQPARWDAVENWTTLDDLITFLTTWSLDAAPFHPARSIDVHAFDGEHHRLNHQRPLVYVVKRGDGPDCLDASLKEQALELGVRLRYGETLARERADIWATGVQRRGFFLDTGVTFRTSLPDRVTVLVDQRLTPKAFAYLIVVDGVGTVAILLTQQFRRARELLNKTVEAFQRMQPFDMRDVHLRSGFGGALNTPAPSRAPALAVGEAAGFLDFLWGFGIRQAMLSGALAAHALLEGVDYATLVAREVRPLVQSSLINRKLYDYANNHAYRALIRYFCARQNLHAALHRFYRARRLRSMLWPWVMRSFAKTPS